MLYDRLERPITGRESDIITELVSKYHGARTIDTYIAIPRLGRYVMIPTDYILKLIRQWDDYKRRVESLIKDHLTQSYNGKFGGDYTIEDIEVTVTSDALRYCVYHINKDYLNLRR